MQRSYILIYNGNVPELETDLTSRNLTNYIILNNTLASLYVDEDFNELTFDNIDSVFDWIRSIPMSSLIEIGVGTSGGERPRNVSGVNYIEQNPYINPSGKDTIIVILDSGINYLHPDFIRDDNTTKILSIWDQTTDKGNPPIDLKFGSEFTSEEINRYISENDASLTQDTIGTGTIAAGIVSGTGRLNNAYRGIALDSELVIVKLREHEGVYKEGRISYELTDFLAGIKYAIEVAERTQKRMVINLTIGGKSEAVVLTSMLESFDRLLRPGTIIVSGLGNEGNTDTHYRGKIDDMNTVSDILIQVGEQKNLEITVSCVGPDKINGSIISPSGELSYTVAYTPDQEIYTGRFNIERTNYEVRYLYPWLKSGTQELVINLTDIKPGIWTLRLTPEFIITGDYDVFLPNKNLIDEETRFINSNSFSTTTWFAATDNVIGVGGYNNKIDSMWIRSSRGTINQNPIKPDIVAPGVDIIGPYKNDEHIKASGTGISSSIVSGVAAILMEYLRSQSYYSRNLLFTEVIKTYLMIGADKKDIYTYPNVNMGYGLLNFRSTMQQIAKNLR
ncbi:PII-type proteinase precursor [uncultured Clostridium sp.]|nr:PII-type proteinase precursor [uncultured Clostridium sp.]SCI80844.1 PII-type proteinase precursor [uncultured Clostridium sp.]